MSGKCGFTRAPQPQIKFENSQKLSSDDVEKDKQAAQKASQNNCLETHESQVKHDYQSIDVVIKQTKTRCTTLKKIIDEVEPKISCDDDETRQTVSQLKELWRKSQIGLSQLLIRKCCFHLLQDDHLYVYYYANELLKIAEDLSSSELIQIVNVYFSKKFVINIDRQRTHVFDLDNEENIRMFMENTRESLTLTKEFSLLYKLDHHFSESCEFQLSLDLNNRLLKIACEIINVYYIVRVLRNLAHLYLLLGKYDKSYAVMKKMSDWKFLPDIDKSVLFCNLSVVELLKSKYNDSLKHAKMSLNLALNIQEPSHKGCAFGNIGLAYEYMGRYKEAIEPYELCLDVGMGAKNSRVVNNGLCNLGRAYQGLGNSVKAKEYYLKALNTERPTKAFWCDTEEFRFSPDYLLAKLRIKDGEWQESEKLLRQVIDRCEGLRKSIDDSLTKITFNQTQRKPYQLLQHVLIQSGNVMEALLVAEKGRARDFFDRIEKERDFRIDSVDDLLNMIEQKKIAVMFISNLEEVGKLYFWLISSRGKLLKHYSIPSTEYHEIFTNLDFALRKTQGRYKIEIRGDINCGRKYNCFSPLVSQSIELVEQWLVKKEKDEPQGDFDDSKKIEKNKAAVKPFHGNDAVVEDVELFSQPVNCLKNEENAIINDCNTRFRSPTETCSSLAEQIEKLSNLLVKPIEKELEAMMNQENNDDKPKLLIVPQWKTFNVPFSALKLRSKPLCYDLTILEAFSFESFEYSCSTKRTTSESKNSPLGNALVVGNPTHEINLQFAEDEAYAVGEMLNVKPLIRNEATKTAVMRLITTARVIHFACHGNSDGSALALANCGGNLSDSDVLMTKDDVEKLKINADLVVLSACNTARGSIKSEGVVGVARAFQLAGARSVVTALWAIPDEATKCFMKHFYRKLIDGKTVADAVRATQVFMLDDKKFNDVVNWGSFVVLGANPSVMKLV
ncbi:tetratricopeptide repeat protein 28-like [Xenia sp. Carnegie-2017]|uniref:tetratricopeptide repeat protein 28-like n=1 Tax=Xenia sp. Carnegie-2017 TaxID=2897299 RepID=UPI001F04E187|nr:tetratricopeptide repeat protein 28-like [Xenia sp. Carnegie-2017]